MSREHVMAGQRLLGVKEDGDFGPATLAALRRALAAPVTAQTKPVSAVADQPWMVEARSVMGLHEIRDKAKLSAWLKSGGKYLGDPSQMPWCGDFVETALAKGLPGEKLTGTLALNPFWARNWLTFGVSTDPTRDCVLVFEREGGGHVGFAVGQDDDDYFVLGGNQGNAVSIVAIAKSRLLGARWPATFARRPIHLPRMTLNVARSTNEA